LSWPEWSINNIMNIALIVDQSFSNYRETLPLEKFCRVFVSEHKNKSLALMQTGLMLDQSIFIDGHDIDYVLYAIHPYIKWDEFLTLTAYQGSFYNTIWYTGNIKNMSQVSELTNCIRGNFYCAPKVFSFLSSCYKINLNIEPIEKFKLKCSNGDDVDFIRHRYMIERSNIKGCLFP
jgi:hypothetical protein